MKLALEAGVRFEFQALVERIDVNGDQARGVTLTDGRTIQAEAVLANADLPYVYQDLLPHCPQGYRESERLARKRFSCSVISFFWGVDKTYDQLRPHMLFLADDYRDNFDSIIRDLDLPANPCLYIHASARLDRAMSPQ